jgi:hypothetical protein
MSESMIKFLEPLTTKLDSYNVAYVLEHAIAQDKMNESMIKFLEPLTTKLDSYDVVDVLKHVITHTERNKSTIKLLAPLATKMDHGKGALIEKILYSNNYFKIQIITELLNADWSTEHIEAFKAFESFRVFQPVEHGISTLTVNRILALKDDKVRIATLNNFYVLGMLLYDKNLRTQVFDDKNNKNILLSLKDAMPKSIKLFKVLMKKGEEEFKINNANSLEARELQAIRSETVGNFFEVRAALTPLYVQTHWEFQNDEAVEKEMNDHIKSLRTDLAILGKIPMTQDVNEGLDRVEELIKAKAIDPVHFITMLNVLRDSPSERLRRTLGNMKNVFAYHYAEKTNLDPRKASLEQTLYNQANTSFDLDSYAVNSPNASTSNLQFQDFVDGVLNQNVKLKEGYIDRSIVVAAAQKFYKTNEELYKTRSFWDNKDDLEDVNSAGRMLIEFLRESVTSGATGGKRCAGGVATTMALTTLRAFDPEFDTYNNIDYTKDLRCKEAL